MSGDGWGPRRRWASWEGVRPRVTTYRLLLVIALLGLAGWVVEALR